MRSDASFLVGGCSFSLGSYSDNRHLSNHQPPTLWSYHGEEAQLGQPTAFNTRIGRGWWWVCQTVSVVFRTEHMTGFHRCVVLLYLLCLSLDLVLVLVEMELPTQHPGPQQRYWVIPSSFHAAFRQWAVLKWNMLLCFECIPRQQPPLTWRVCLCHRKPLWNSRVATPADDVHLCIMCLRAIMNYQVSQTTHTYSQCAL